MPANLTPQYFKAEEAYKAAATPEEKLSCLEEMLRQIPKHKGTEKLQADLKRRMASLKKEGSSKGKASRTDPFHVVKAGGGQIVLLGSPNCGKSQLVGAVSRARVEISEQPFSTQKPAPGMMLFEDAPIQLLDLPPITTDYIPPGMMGAVRNADGVLVICDLSADDLLEQMELALETCEEHKITLHPPQRPKYAPEELPIGEKQHPALIIGTKNELPQGADNLKILTELLGDRLPLLSLSAVTGTGMDNFRYQVYSMLDLIRAYSKEPGKPCKKDTPFLLKRGATVIDLAQQIHKDLAGHLKFARIWGSARHDGIQVARDHILVDKDIVEIHS